MNFKAKFVYPKKYFLKNLNFYLKNLPCPPAINKTAT